MILLMALAGGLGALLRYMIGVLLTDRFTKSSFPVPMVAVNLAGSFGLGLFLGLYLGYIPLDAYEDPVFLMAGVGFFGAFTTFSTFAVETITLLRRGAWMPALWYSSITIIGSLGTFLFGFLLAGPS